MRAKVRSVGWAYDDGPVDEPEPLRLPEPQPGHERLPGSGSSASRNRSTGGWSIAAYTARFWCEYGTRGVGPGRRRDEGPHLRER